MKKPSVVRQGEQVETVGKVFGTPVVVKGRTWLPLTELVVWLGMAWLAGRRRPGWSWGKRLGLGGLEMATMLGSEWCHNLAHAAAARYVGKPMDALRVAWGMPLVVYYDINDRTVTPKQHIARALGGPLFNAALLTLALVMRRLTRSGSSAHELADLAVKTNLFLCSASLLPLPIIDGGPLLKWLLVENGYSVGEADCAVRRVDRFLGVGLGVAAGAAIQSGRKILGAFLGLFAAMALAFGFRLVEE